MQKNEVVGVKICGHSNTNYKYITYLGDIEALSLFDVVLLDGTLVTMYAEQRTYFNDTLEELINVINTCYRGRE